MEKNSDIATFGTRTIDTCTDAPLKKSVLLVNAGPTIRNGITNVIFNYIKALDKNKINIGYVSISPIESNFQDFLDSQNVKTYISSKRISNPLRYVSELASVAKEYDIVHAHGNSSTLVLEMVAAKLAGCKLRIAHSHNTTCNSKLLHILLNPLFQTLCNGRLACGKNAGNWLFGKRNFTVINNGIDNSKFQFNKVQRNQIRTELGWHSEIIVGNVGNLNNQKNHKFLLNVFAKAVKEKPDLRLLILGEGRNRISLESQIKDLQIEDKVNLIGNVPNVNEYLNAVDLIAMPSLFEGLPLSLIEEQANGLECIIADTITTEADKTGTLTFVPLNEGEWVDAILKAEVNSDKRETKSENAVRKIKNCGYDIQTEVTKLEKIYNSK